MIIAIYLLNRKSAQDNDCESLKASKLFYTLRTLAFCNALQSYNYGHVHAIPPYRVYQLYDKTLKLYCKHT